MIALEDGISHRDTNGRANSSVSLFTHLSRCQSNYRRLQKLLSEGSTSIFRSRSIDFEWAGIGAPFVFNCHKLGKYTSQVVINQNLPGEIPNLHLKLHVYHDARSAEVVSYQRHHNFQVLDASPQYPRTHRFEKFEMNVFLTELLDCCLECVKQFQRDSRTDAT